MFPWNEFLVDLGLLVVLFTAFVLGTLMWRPRIWLHDFPEDIQERAAPKTKQEQRLTALLGVPFILLFVGLPVYMVWDLNQTLGGDLGFLDAWLYAFALFLGVGLWDLVVLDWIGFSLVDPQNPPIAGTEGAVGWHDYAFHFYAFLKGCVLGLVVATLAAGLVTLFAPAL